MLPRRVYPKSQKSDPFKLYFWPLLGSMYRKRVELCLSELKGGGRILEVGFGSGVTFSNLNEKYNEIHGLDLNAFVDDVSSFYESLGIKVFLKNENVVKMSYPDGYFDAVLLISVCEHLYPEELMNAFNEIYRVLKNGGQVVYGMPIERPFMVWMFRLLGFNIREHHFSTHNDVLNATQSSFKIVNFKRMKGVFPFSIFGYIYEIGHFTKKRH